MRKRPPRWPSVVVTFLILCGLGGMVALVVLATPDATHVAAPGKTVKAQVPLSAPTDRPAFVIAPLPRSKLALESPIREIPPRRFPIAGADGYTVVLNADGTSYLEGPTGRHDLVDKTLARTPSERELAVRIAERIKKSAVPVVPQREGLGQLVVLDDGVVDIPKGSVVTLTAADKLVVLNGDGTSTVYHASGKIERRERTREATSPVPKPPNKKE